MLHWLAQAFSTYVLHPLHGNGYQLWSGAASGGPWVAAIGMVWHRHNCHEAGCLRIVRHGQTLCPKHRERTP